MEQQIDFSYRKVRSDGYVYVKAPGHPRADDRDRVAEHILVAENAVGFYLPLPIEIHHFNGNKEDNRNGNLIICQDHSYHALLHRRQANLARGVRMDDPRPHKKMQYEIDETILFKSCPHCLLILPASSFSKSSSCKGGLYGRCKTCEREKKKIYLSRPEVQMYHASEEFRSHKREYRSMPEVKNRLNEIRRIKRRGMRVRNA